MTRILRLLLIAAIALPMWQPIAAQEAVEMQTDENLVQIINIDDMQYFANSNSFHTFATKSDVMSIFRFTFVSPYLKFT